MNNRRASVSQPYRTRGTGRRILFLTLVFALFLGLLSPARSQESHTGHEAITDYIYTLLQYVRWPNWRAEGSTSEPFLIAVAGDSTLVDVLRDRKTIASMNGRKLRIEHLADLKDILKAQVLMMTTDDPRQIAHILSSVGEQPILTVLISERRVQMGTVLTLRKEPSPTGLKIQLTIDENAAEKGGVRLSSHLFRLEKSK